MPALHSSWALVTRRSSPPDILPTPPGDGSGTWSHPNSLASRTNDDSNAAFQKTLMQHMLALEVLISLLLFTMVLIAAFFALRYLPLFRRGRPAHAVTLHSADQSTVSLKPLPKSPLPTPIRAGHWRESPRPSVLAISATSNSSRPITPLRADSPTRPTYGPGPTSSRSSSPLTELSPSGSNIPLRVAQGQHVMLLDEELQPARSSAEAERARYAPPSSAPPGKKSARRLSVPRSAWGTTTDGASAIGSGAGYTSVSDFLNRLQHTYPKYEVSQYAGSFGAHGIHGLDDLRGITSARLRSMIKTMPQDHADFLARSINAELEWTDADRERGGLGFRMVLTSQDPARP
ncbi:hypothetical protein AURDEDRAFT_186560 [Auricularia subglabra TFB-10046 SS5]|uniref:SAM domain-containing protein n=1 Tax=Auricularia subglabra (strain TFB-10046 / SS5) TaxID=717982 RepID=J0WXC2_AURST|nr:hypothetical protein AURDEDRAFT_186560 [Auricularia subglabra TFB-10046 SS5]